jgi:hypothetical protein
MSCVECCHGDGQPLLPTYRVPFRPSTARTTITDERSDRDPRLGGGPSPVVDVL